MPPVGYNEVAKNILPPIPSPGVSINMSILDSTTDGITANPGGGQSGAVVLKSKFNNVTTVGTAGDSVALPAAIAGLTVVVRNATATSMNVFPVNGGTDKINALSANAAFAQTQGTTTFRCYTAGTWLTS